MTPTERTDLVAPCGIDCGVCELHTCAGNEQLTQYLLGRGIPADRLPCPGCRAIKGACPVLKEPCATYACVQEKGVGFCCDCSAFPCNKLCPAADRADVLPHNLKAFNLAIIKHRGVDAFINESAGAKARYFKGKMAVGQGPQV